MRKGYRFKGVASVLESGPVYDKAITSTKSGRAAVRDREKALRLIIRDGTEPAAEDA